MKYPIFINMLLGMNETSRAHEETMCKEFDARAELDRKKYWDACKYPRKTKKRMRKEAAKDFQFHKYLAQPVLFTF